MIRWMAVDASLTATGWAATNDAWDTVTGTINPRILVGTRWRKLAGPQRLAWIAANIRRLARQHHAEFVAIEGYSYGSYSSAVTKLAELGGVLRVTLYGENVPAVEIAPATIKLYATGKGNADKTAMLDAARAQLDYRGGSHDQADALWLHALIAHALGMPRIRLAPGDRRLDALDPAIAALDSLRPKARP